MAHQVADLVEQFVRLDAFLMDFIFEAALKLASLTDGQLFMMIETSEGRRFAGKDHLCEMYLKGDLKPVGSEMKYHLDNHSPSITKQLVTPPPPPPPNAFNHRNMTNDFRISNSSTAVIPISSSTRTLKRKSASSSSSSATSGAIPSSTSPAKSARLSFAEFAAESTANNSSEVEAVKKEVNDEIFLIDDDDEDDFREDHGGGGGGGSGGGEGGSRGTGVVEDLNNSQLDFSAVDFNSTMDMQQHGLDLQHHGVDLQHQGGGGGGGGGQMELEALNSSVFDESHETAANEFFRLNPKAEALVQMPSECFSANSPGLRLLNSLGYEYAKYMSQFCPVDIRSGDLLHREFFAGAFQRFWDHFPSLLEANEESFKAICLLRKTDPSRVRGYKGLGLMTKTRANMSSFFLRFARRAKGIAE